MLKPLLIPRYLEFAQKNGVSEAQLLRGLDIDVSLLRDADYKIKFEQYLSVVEQLVSLFGDKGLGLRIGNQREAQDFGILGFAALASETPREALERFWAQYGQLHGVVTSIKIARQDKENHAVDLIIPRASEHVERFIIEESLAFLAKVGQQVTGKSVPFKVIPLSYKKPCYWKEYSRQFHCNVYYRRDVCRVILPSKWMEMPLKNADTQLTQLYNLHLDKLAVHESREELVSRRLQKLFQQTNSAPATQEASAEALGLNARTLRRRLAAEGLTYRQLREEFKRNLALEMVRDTNLGVKQIAHQLGFDDTNAFRRAFKRWTEVTVTVYRNNLKT